MKLKEILSDIKEEFEAGLNNEYGYREIFKNPIQQELNDVTNNTDFLRFVAIGGYEDVFVASGDVMHSVILDKIGYVTIDFENMFCGVGRYEKEIDVLDFSEMYQIDRKSIEGLNILCERILKGKYDWMGKYNFNLEVIKQLADDYLEDG